MGHSHIAPVGLAAALVLYASQLHAQEVVAVPPGNDMIVPVRKGESVPYDGQLFSNDTSLRWANWLMQYKNLVKDDKELQQKLCAADLGLQQKKNELERDQYARVTKELQDKLAEAQKAAAEGPAWYKTSTFGFVLGVLGTAAVVAGSAAVFNAVK